MKITKITVKSKPTKTKAAVTYPPQIEAAIRMKAYEIYLDRNGVAGNEVEDWLTAEGMVLQKNSKKKHI